MQLSSLTSSPLPSTSPLLHYLSNVFVFGLLLIILVSLDGVVYWYDDNNYNMNGLDRHDEFHSNETTNDWISVESRACSSACSRAVLFVLLL
ncbi:hypothetical protein Pint_28326 [Pistacia integerrima]|uniref:Uncharacterized protein n=1 Tax=Pistacia integerrima TaxID=434235 RepID=A0ACC0YV12_9ROSI|nr:hypothetical protein Pint_28326 [Pistacia integerrima]